MTDLKTPSPEAHVLAYRFLVEGDLIEATDEFIGSDGQTWTRPDGWEVGMEYPSRVFKSARRLVSPPSRDQAAGSRPMDEASLPTTSRLSQLEARTSCAASVNDQLTSTGQTPRVGLVGDNQPRYTTKRLHDEIAKAKGYSRREALEDAARVADEEAEMWGYTDGSSARVVAERIRKLVGEDPTSPQSTVIPLNVLIWVAALIRLIGETVRVIAADNGFVAMLRL